MKNIKAVVIILDFYRNHPKLHSLFLVFIIPGVILSWLIFILPFYTYDNFIKDFKPYIQGIKDHWNKNKK